MTDFVVVIPARYASERLPGKPLRQIASGGELSRSLLAIKRVLAGQHRSGLYVFSQKETLSSEKEIPDPVTAL